MVTGPLMVGSGLETWIGLVENTVWQRRRPHTRVFVSGRLKPIVSAPAVLLAELIAWRRLQCVDVQLPSGSSLDVTTKVSAKAAGAAIAANASSTRNRPGLT